MAFFWEVRGADQLKRVGAALKSAGDSGKGLRKELLRGIRIEVKPLVAAAKQGASVLPHSGGLSAEIAGSKFGSRTRLTGGGVGVKIVASNQDAIDRIDKGTVRHPVWNTGKWATQSVPPGWFTKPVMKQAPAVRRRVNRVVREIARRIEGAA